MEHIDDLIRSKFLRGSPEQQATYRSLMSIEPELESGFAGGFRPDEGTLAISPKLDEESIVPTTAHEFQHAFDKRFHPELDKDYPMIGPLGNAPPAYWTHPLEVRANARAGLENRLLEDLESGQQSFGVPEGDYTFLGDLAEGKARDYGNLQAELTRYGPGPLDWINDWAREMKTRRPFQPPLFP